MEEERGKRHKMKELPNLLQISTADIIDDDEEISLRLHVLSAEFLCARRL